MKYKTLVFSVLRFFFRTVGRLVPHLGGRVALRLFCTPFPVKLSTPARAFLAASGSDVLKLAGSEIKVYTRGEGSTVLLLHGWNSHSVSLRSFADPLVERGYRVLGINLPAHGGSSGTRTTMLECSRILAELICSEAPVRGLIAHSFGGPATLLTLRNNPDLPLERLVTIGAPIDMDKVFRDFSVRFEFPDRVEQDFRRRIDDVFGEPFLEFDICAVAATLAERMLVVHDVEDPDVPVSEAYKLASGPGVASLITEGYGHNRILRREAVIQRVVDFIAG